MSNTSTLDGTKTRYLTIKLSIFPDPINAPAVKSFEKFIMCNSGISPDNNSYIGAEVGIQRSFGFLHDTANIIIYGMDDSAINTFTRTNLPGLQALSIASQVTIYAGYSLGSDGLPPFVYSGFVLRAGADYNVSRDRPFYITTMQNYFSQVQVQPPYNPQGQVTIDNMLKAIATNAGYYYQSTGVTGVVKNPIYSGANGFLSQMRQACSDNGYTFKFISDGKSVADSSSDTVFVCPIGQPLTNNVFTLSKNNGMIGYPIIEDFGVTVKLYFNPAIQIGQLIKIDSIAMPFVNNQSWYVNSIQHSLQNKTEEWFTYLQLNTFRFVPQ